MAALTAGNTIEIGLFLKTDANSGASVLMETYRDNALSKLVDQSTVNLPVAVSYET